MKILKTKLIKFIFCLSMSKILKKPGKSTKKEAKKAKLIQDDSDEEPDKKIFEIDETQE